MPGEGLTANVTAKADASASSMSRALDWLRQGAATAATAATTPAHRPLRASLAHCLCIWLFASEKSRP